jgi:ABC-type amino acid transport substrate-binding protein
MRTFTRFAATLALSAAAFAAPEPGAAQSTLDEIIKRGSIKIGMDLAAPPFAFQDEKQQPAGSERGWWRKILAFSSKSCQRRPPTGSRTS